MKSGNILSILVATLLATTVAGFAQLGEDDTPSGDARVRRALDTTDLKYRLDKDGDYRLVFEEDDERTQLVFINSQTTSYGSMELREVWSVGYRPDDDEPISRHRLESLLKKNNTYKFGSWSLTPKGHAVFTVVVSANASGRTLEDAARVAAKVADELELDWDGGDDL